MQAGEEKNENQISPDIRKIVPIARKASTVKPPGFAGTAPRNMIVIRKYPSPW